MGNSILGYRLDCATVAVIINYRLLFSYLRTAGWGKCSLFGLVVSVMLAIPIPTQPAQDLKLQAAALEDLLRWVESASPDEYFQRDASAGAYKFYETFGVAADIPAVGVIAYSNCYSGTVELVPIRGMGDVIYSEAYGRLLRQARDFAIDYNRKMKKFVDAKRLSKCKPDVDWETAFRKLNEFVGGRDRRQGSVGYHPKAKGIFQWTIDILDRNRADSVRTTSCSILAQYGIVEPVDITLNEWLSPPPQEYRTMVLDKFRCIGGKPSH